MVNILRVHTFDSSFRALPPLDGSSEAGSTNFRLKYQSIYVRLSVVTFVTNVFIRVVQFGGTKKSEVLISIKIQFHKKHVSQIGRTCFLECIVRVKKSL